MKNKHVNGPKNYCQLNQFSSCQRILLPTEMSCYVNSVLPMSIFMIYDMRYESNMYLYVAWFIRHCGLGLICFGFGLTENFWPRPHTFWPRPWPHPSLASLTSLHCTIKRSALPMYLRQYVTNTLAFFKNFEINHIQCTLHPSELPFCHRLSTNNTNANDDELPWCRRLPRCSNAASTRRMSAISCSV